MEKMIKPRERKKKKKTKAVRTSARCSAYKKKMKRKETRNKTEAERTGTDAVVSSKKHKNGKDISSKIKTNHQTQTDQSREHHDNLTRSSYPSSPQLAFDIKP